VDEAEQTGGAARLPTPSRFVAAAQLFALCGFAFAQPLLDLLGNNPTFFVAHNAGRWDIVVFTLAVLVVPPALLCAGLAVLRLISVRAAQIVFIGLIGALVALTLVPMVDRTASLSTVVYLVLMLLVGAGAIFAYLRASAVRTFVSWLMPAPLLFAGFFLVATPVSNLVFSDDPEAAAAAVSSDAPVIWLLVDELPLGPMLDENGQIDAARFPNFARLAEISNWYPRAATVARNTLAAVPAMLSGTIPEQDAVPIAAEFPRNLFTMLGRSREMHVNELLQLCPRSLCEGGGTSVGTVGRRQLAKDAGIAYLHAALPSDLAAAWLPPISDRWAGFGDDSTSGYSREGFQDQEDVRSAAHEVAGELNTGYVDWVGSIAPGADGRPGLWFHHLLLPHVPYRYLPDGRTYDYGRSTLPTGVGLDGQRSENRYLSDLSRQQFVLQAAYVDRQLGLLLDWLEARGVLEPSLIVVVADHGVSFQPGGSLRAGEFDRVSRHEIMPVPMFVKLPGQTTGKADARAAQSIDLLPTVADALGIELSDDWATAGTSLLGDDEREAYVFADELQGDRVPAPDARKVAKEFTDALGTSDQTHDLYRVRPYGALIGRPVAELATSPTATDLRLTFDPAAADRRPGRPFLAPTRFVAQAEGGSGAEWVAISVNGVIAATAQVAEVDGSPTVIAMLDPALLVAGHNEIEVREIIERDDGSVALAEIG
jgi:hypothetical protein